MAGSVQNLGKGWEHALQMRRDRREYLSKRDFDIAGVFSRAAGPLLMVVMFIVIAFEAHAYYTIALPWLELPGWLENGIAAVSAMVVVRIFVDYARTSLTDPGRPEAGASLSEGFEVAHCPGVAAMGAAPTSITLAEDAELGSIKLQRCGPCGGPKPARCHHCRVCRRCVLKMDHHCPFVNNCVGLRNHQYFCFFLLDLVIGSVVLVACLAPQVLSLVFYGNDVVWARKVHIIICFVIATIAFSLLTPFFGFHMYLVVMDQTTLENLRHSNPSRSRGLHVAAQDDTPGTPDVENLSAIFGTPPVWLRRLLEVIAPKILARFSFAKRNV